MARLILRRVGITPILPVLALALLASPPVNAARAATNPSPAIATARVIILSRAVRLERGRVTLVAPRGEHEAAELPLLTEAVERPCDPADRAGGAAAACRLIVTNLP